MWPPTSLLSGIQMYDINAVTGPFSFVTQETAAKLRVLITSHISSSSQVNGSMYCRLHHEGRPGIISGTVIHEPPIGQRRAFRWSVGPNSGHPAGAGL